MAAVRARIDYVLLDDGTAYGEDVSRSHARFIQWLSARRSVEKWILSLLETQGPDKTRKVLREELARQAVEQKYFHPRRIVGGKTIEGGRVIKE